MQMTLGSLLRLLGGNRAAIVQIANCRQAIWVGLIFVLSAGLAREYDGADLAHEPWKALLPVAASLLTSFVLHSLVWWVVPWRPGSSSKMSFWNSYRRFLSLYWATAPLAWLYAIPVERLMTTGSATEANLAFLGIVSVWRVALITRVISILWTIPLVAAFFTVMFFADCVVLTAMWAAPWPIIDVMGGIHHSERENIIATTLLISSGLSMLLFPVWSIGTAVQAARLRRIPVPEQQADEKTPETRSVSAGLWCTAVASVFGWSLILPLTQPEQVNRRIVEAQLRSGQIPEAIAFLAVHQRGDFPPLWDPPPQLGYGETTPGINEVLSILASRQITPRLRAAFADKLMDQFSWHERHQWIYKPPFFRVLDAPDDELRHFVELVETIPEGPKIAAAYQDEVKSLLDPKHANEFPNPPLTAPRLKLLERLKKLGAAADGK